MTKITAKQNIRLMIEIALFAAITAVLAQVSIPLPSGVPITLQTFAVALTGCYLGRKYGLTSVFVYIVLGAVGLPVFASLRGGFAVIAGATGGFIIGFLPLTSLCGLGASLRNKITAVAAILTGLIICHISGILWFSFVTSTAVLSAAVLVSLPYIVKDAVSVIAALYISSAVKAVIGKTTGR